MLFRCNILCNTHNFPMRWKVKVLIALICLMLCDPMDCSPPGSSVQRVLQVWTLEWVASAFPRGFSQPRDRIWVSYIAGTFFTRVKSESCSVVSDSLWAHGLYSPWNSPDQNTGVGCHSLLQGFSQQRDWTQVSGIADRLFTSWATIGRSY